MLLRTRFLANLTLVFVAALIVSPKTNAQHENVPKSGSSPGLITSVPRTITYQAILKDSDGNPMPNESVNITFRIYNDWTAGDLLWEDALAIVTDDGGYFNASLVNLNLPFDEDYFLELQVEGESPMTPRAQFSMSAYAARTDTSDFSFAGGGWVDDGPSVRLETSSDKVGIGTSSPGNKLHIVGSESVPILNVEQHGSFRAARFFSQNACALWVENAGNHGLRITNAGGRGVYVQNAGSDGIYVANAGGWAGYFNGTGYFSGNVGIGTTTPDYKLDVEGTVGIDIGSNYADVPLTINVPANQAGLISRIAKGGSVINVVDSDGNVGIGTFSPAEKLDVAGTAQITGFKMPTGASDGYVLTSDISGEGTWQVATGGGIDGSGTANYVPKFTASSTLGNSIIYDNGSSVGIGTTSPTYKLDVEGTVGIDIGSNFGDVPLTIDVPANQAGLISRIAKGGSVINVVDSDGNVGIGTFSPAEKLDVAGTARITGLKMPTGASDGYVLTSDVSGVGTWQAAPGGSDSDWFFNGNDLYAGVSGNVGIGNASPSEKLEVNGSILVTNKATIGTGHSNTGANSFVAGANNTVSGNTSTVGGGNSNIVAGNSSIIGGGFGNNVQSVYSSIGGGLDNYVNGENGVIAGGFADTALGLYSAVSGGYSNLAGDSVDDTAACVGGGFNNSATAQYTTISGGQDNTASFWGCTVGGGNRNTVDGYFSTISGGYENMIDGNYSMIPGGADDTITVNSAFCMAVGEGVYINSMFRTVFYDAQHQGYVGINRDDSDGGINYPIHVGTASNNGNGAYLHFDGNWYNPSSREFKENSQPLVGESLLNDISNLTVESWQYRGSSDRHIGPYAEEFNETFHVASSRENGTKEMQYITSGDVAGVALAGVKELIQKNKELKDLISQLEKRITDLENIK